MNANTKVDGYSFFLVGIIFKTKNIKWYHWKLWRRRKFVQLDAKLNIPCLQKLPFKRSYQLKQSDRHLQHSSNTLETHWRDYWDTTKHSWNSFQTPSKHPWLGYQGVFFFLPSYEPRQGQPDFLWNFVEVWPIRQLKIYKFAEIPWLRVLFMNKMRKISQICW